MAPFDLAALIIDRSQERSAGQVVVGAGPAVFAMLGFEEVNAVTVLRADDEEASLGIETGRPIIRRAILVRRDESSVASRFFVGVGNRTALLVDTFRPVH